MSTGQVVVAPDGTEVTLVDVGQKVLLENDLVRVWDVTLPPGAVHPWHLHKNPYVVLSIQASPGRMDWLDGSPARYLDEYRGGAVLRPTSPVHRLTNIGDTDYCNRLVELKALGELRPAGTPEPDMGDGMRSIHGEAVGEPTPEGLIPVLPNSWASVWNIQLPAGSEMAVARRDVPALVAPLEVSLGSLAFHPAGADIVIANQTTVEQEFFVVTMDYLRTSS